MVGHRPAAGDDGRVGRSAARAESYLRPPLFFEPAFGGGIVRKHLEQPDERNALSLGFACHFTTPLGDLSCEVALADTSSSRQAKPIVPVVFESAHRGHAEGDGCRGTGEAEASLHLATS